MALRAMLAAVFVIFGVAGTVTAAGLFEIDEFTRQIKAITGDTGTDLPEPGDPQTIMLLGTDARLGADAGSGARADTIILARLDASKEAITLTSIPRDLKVTIPGQEGEVGVTDKINSAYARGGVKLTVKTVKELFAVEGEPPFKINHVVQVDFLGFRRMVDYLGCSYVDIDRDYFNDVSGPGGYAVIDIDPGYQKLCGEDALAYVRYRHTDNDLVRASRQQDFLRQMLRQPGVEKRLSLGKRKEITKIAGTYTRVDKSLTEKKPLLTLLKLGLNVAGKTVQQVPFGAGEVAYEGDYLTVPRSAIKATRRAFLDPAGAPDSDASPSAPAARKSRRSAPAVPEGLMDVEDAGKTQAIAVNRRMRFPFFYPELGVGGYDGDARLYSVAGHQAYRMVVPLDALQGQYYGIQGMKWNDAPLLEAPHDTVKVDGRTLDVYYDGKRVRLVAWRRGSAVYYVHNTLDRALSRQQLTAIARSLTRLR